MNHRYLIIPKEGSPFNTQWFQPENHYNKGDIIFDLATGKMYKGNEWVQVSEDHL